MPTDFERLADEMGLALREQAETASDRPNGPEALAARAAAGDDSVWPELIGAYAKRVYAFAKSRLRDAHVAEEVTQSVFATVAIKVRDGAYDDRGRFEPWLFRIASNRIRDEVRRRRAAPSMTSEPRTFDECQAGDASPDQAEPGLDPGLVRLREALEQLPEADREVISLRHHGQMSFKQIAELTGEPTGTLLARHHRALAKLRAIMEADIEPDAEGEGTDRPVRNQPTQSRSGRNSEGTGR